MSRARILWQRAGAGRRATPSAAARGPGFTRPAPLRVPAGTPGCRFGQGSGSAVVQVWLSGDSVAAQPAAAGDSACSCSASTRAFHSCFEACQPSSL
ncbi:hypothetical protein GCM10027073_18790 [Streptomyces chlorus]